ncbi:MAG: gamma carbonic anhydrase family protein [Thermoplasmatales archaeon]
MKVGKNVFIADNARIIGNVTIGDEVSVFYGAVIRADQNSVTIGAKSNIQDNVVIHCDEDNSTVIGENVSVGHAAIIHGARVGSNALIGMGSILLSGSVVEEGAIVGAGSLVTSGTTIGRNCLAVGSPAKVIRCEESIGQRARKNGEVYQALMKKHLSGYYDRYI